MNIPDKYLEQIEKTLDKWYKDVGCGACRCGDPTRLAISGLKDNPDRLYFCC